MSRKRRAPPSFEWNPIPDDDEEPRSLPDIMLKHSHYNLDLSGPSSSRTSYLRAPASPSKKAGPSSTYYEDNYTWNEEPAPLETNASNHAFIDPAYAHFLDINEPGPPRCPRTVEVSYHCCQYYQCPLTMFQDDPLKKWIPDHDKFLWELIRLDGRGDRELWSSCRLCDGICDIRCEECFGGEMFCRKCTVDLHAVNPLHRIEVGLSLISICVI